MSKPKRNQQGKQEQFKAESEKAVQAEAQSRNQPADIANKTRLQRQSKKQHQQDGK